MSVSRILRTLRRQPDGAPRLSPRYAGRIAFMQVGGSVFDGYGWSQFAQTAQQKIAYGRFGAGVATTADSTPDTYTVRGFAQFDECGIVVAADKASATTFDYALEVGGSAGVRIAFGTASYALDEIGIERFGSSFLYAPPASALKLPKTGAMVWRNNFGGLTGDVHTDGAMVASGSVSNSVPYAIDSVSIGGRLGLSNRNWRGNNFLSAVISQLTQREAQAISGNPWGELFAPRRIFVPVSAGGGAVSLVAADIVHGHTIDAVVLSSATALAVADALHAHAADNLTLGTTGSATLTAADATHAHAADAPALTTSAYLAAADALHAHAADGVTLGVSGVATLAPDDAAHAHSADNITLTSAHLLAVADATHAHTADGVTLSTATLLAIADALHDHAADNVALSSAPFLQIADGLHAHTVDGVTLVVDAWLVVADASHGHIAESVVLLLPGGAIYPDPATVLAGIVYGPNGVDYIGTLAAPTAGDIAAAVLAALNATTIPTNVKKVNDVTIKGTGVTGNTWGPA